MRHRVTPGWREVHIGAEADGLQIAGVDIWKTEWHSLGYSVWLGHPQWPQQIHDYVVYEANDGSIIVRFAAAELSNGCWGFYIPARS